MLNLLESTLCINRHTYRRIFGKWRNKKVFFLIFTFDNINGTLSLQGTRCDTNKPTSEKMMILRKFDY